MTKIEFTGKMVGLIVRGKKNQSHEPGVMEQHADCVLPDGSPIGFFGEGGANTGEKYASASWNRSGMNMKGVVYDYNLLKIHRPYYVDSALAKKYDVVSTLLVIETDTSFATIFTDYWRKLQAKPKGFQLVGGNCSTRASGAFVASKILLGGIPGLDTPDHLYQQLVRMKKGKTHSYSGYIGFVPKKGGGYDVIVDEP